MPSWNIPAALLWVSVTGLVVVLRILKGAALDSVLIVVFIGGLAGLLFLGPVLTIWLLSIGWAWRAARENGASALTYMKILVFVGIFEAFLGMVQHFVAPRWIPGYDGAANDLVTGTLINRNHFAGLLEMLIPCCLGLGFIAYCKRGSFSYSNLYVMAGAFCGIALAISQSRMGIFCLFASMVLLRVLFPLRAVRRTLVSGLFTGFIGIVVAGVLWLGVDAIVGRYGQLVKADAALAGGRITIYKNTINMIRHFPLGVGIGNYADTFPPFQTVANDFLFDHAHNDYLETTAEWGVLVAIPFWAAIFGLFGGLIRLLLSTPYTEIQGILLACIGGIFAILLHSLADFNLQIPSNAIAFFSMVGIGMGILFPKKPLHSEDADPIL
jgi:hypothetical protein